MSRPQLPHYATGLVVSILSMVVGCGPGSLGPVVDAAGGEVSQTPEQPSGSMRNVPATADPTDPPGENPEPPPTEPTDPGEPTGPLGGPIGGGGTPPAPTGPCELEVPDLALQEVAIYQGVKITLFEDGSPVGTTTDVVEERAALVRAFIRPEAGWTEREVTGRLTLSDPNGDQSYEDTFSVGETSRDDDAGTTFNFEIPEDIITEDTEYTVELFEPVDSCAQASSPSRYPASGGYALNARDTGTFRVVLVPIRYDGGNGEEPDTSPAVVDGYTRALAARFPTKDIDVSVRTTVGWSAEVFPDGTGMEQLLNALLVLRDDDNVDPDVYYYGLIAPGDSLNQFCQQGCVLGLAPAPGPTETFLRAGLGLGFPSNTAIETLIHELGHTLGREHAPCGNPAGPDQDYPYANASVGVWGYDLDNRVLLPPTNRADVMSYCDPTWISDYTYQGILERFATTNSTVGRAFLSSMAWSTLWVDRDGNAQWGDTFTGPRPSGQRVTASAFDNEGNLVETFDAYVMELHETGATMVFLPTGTPAWAEVVVGGFGTYPVQPPTSPLLY